MIDIIIEIAKLISAMLPMILLFLLAEKVNLKKPLRSRQFFMPLVAIIYVIVAMIFTNEINSMLLGFIQNLPKWIEDIANSSWMPSGIAEIIGNFSGLIEDFINSLNLDFWIFYISNTIIMLVFVAIKKICVSIMNAIFKNGGSLFIKISGMFYEYFEQRDVWCIRDNFSDVRRYLNTFYLAGVIISSILMVISSNFYLANALTTVFYPVYGIILVGELFFYLDGVTKPEYTNKVLGENEDAYKTVNYSLLRKFMRNVFGDKLLSENTTINNALTYGVTTDEILQNLEMDEDPKIVAFATYMKAIKSSGFSIDHNYLYSSRDLLNGKSILFNNPFYNDLIPYAFYPMNRALLSHKKVLVVLGRHAIEDDITEWISKGIEAVTNIPFMWNVGVLTNEPQDGIDIGIISRSDVLDMKLQKANADFLHNVGYFVIIEPSKLISTAQIGLNLIVKECRARDNDDIVFCLCDKNCDGLVDAMSHILMTSITEVSATNKHLGTSSYICWSADNEYLHHRLLPNISRYLGMGTELSFAALKNQVSNTYWYGGEAFPVTDVNWIDKQYYYDLLKYAGLPTNQEFMDECFHTSAGFWDAGVEKYKYITVEDEAYNMFEIVRDFSTRATDQGFVNVICSEYLLKDYMADNATIFAADAKAIPYIVADYARTKRNITLRMLLMMSTYEVSYEILKKEFSLLGVGVFDFCKQLWYEIYKCFADTASVASLSSDYRTAVNEVYGKGVELSKTVTITKDIIFSREIYNADRGVFETVYSVRHNDFISMYISDLKSAGYIAEDEKGEKYYLGAELKGHIYQKYLPGQMFTFGGKYYEMQYLTADGQVLVRRAADHINGRQSYRQLRKYNLLGIRSSSQIGASKNISGLKVVKEYADISVDTDGYYLMDRYNDFATAKKVLFEGDLNGIPQRLYRNKEILRIELPQIDNMLSESVRYTITVLFNEIFRSIFAENQPYIIAVTDDSHVSEDEKCRPLTYSINSVLNEFSKNYIYIIEDSQLDLGLTIAVERNINRIFEIIQDYLNWHMLSLKRSLNPPVKKIEQPVDTAEEPQGDESDNGENKKKKGIFSKIKNFFKKIKDKIKGFFKRKKKKPSEERQEEVQDEGSNTPEEPVVEDNGDNNTPVYTPAEDTESEENPVEKTAEESVEENPDEETVVESVEETSVEEKTEEIVDENSADNSTNEENTDENGTLETELPMCFGRKKKRKPVYKEMGSEKKEQDPVLFKKLPYHERYYLLFGLHGEPSSMDIGGAQQYMNVFCIDKNSLKQARDNKNVAKLIEKTFRPNKSDARYCDFCGCEILGIEYETLMDGRDRCIPCGRTSVKTEQEFRNIFEDVRRNMESFFGIKINAGIRVEMVNAKKLNKIAGNNFIPTPKNDGRVLGLAMKDKNGFTLLIENGAPRMSSMLTMAHELTHIWQYQNWDDKQIRNTYGKKMRLEIYEGMAKWVEIQYAYLINEPAIAKREEIITAYRNDEYGNGFIRYRANYPFSTGTVITGMTPFMNKQYPLDIDFCGAVSIPIEFLQPPGLPEEDEADEGYDEYFDDPTPVDKGDGMDAFIADNGALVGSVERNPQSVPKFAYATLNDVEKKIYDVILNSINEFKSAVTKEELLGLNFNSDLLSKINDSVKADNPQLIWYSGQITYSYDSVTKIITQLEPLYCMTKDEAAERQNKIEQAVPAFLESVTDTMSDFEAVLRIYEKLISLVDYDSISLDKQEKTNSANDPSIPDDLRSVYGTLVNRKAVCAGYSKAFQYLLNRIGIECHYVVGEASSESHAWNLIKLEGDYYYVDSTWGDYSNTMQSKNVSGDVQYDYFCITTKELLLDHKLTDSIALPECVAEKCNFYVRTGAYFETYDFEKIKNIIFKAVSNGKHSVSIKFKDKSAYNQAKRELIDGTKFYEILQFINLKKDRCVNSSSYTYSEDRKDKGILKFFIKKL